jgi:endonuclease/exonuclease/phosphatase family metal-dependent hydrolase
MAAFTVMTWNVENFFPVGHKDSNTGKTVTAEEFNAKLEYLVQRITEFNPDVIGLQEMGPQECLDALTEALGGKFKHSSLSKHPDGRGIRVAFISQHALEDVQHWDDFPDGALQTVPDWPKDDQERTVSHMSRGALSVIVEVAGTRIHLVNTHMKSKLVTYPATHPGGKSRFGTDDENERARGAGLALLRRTAEAVAVRTNLNANMLEHTILLGDMNDEPQSATSQLLLGPSDGDIDKADKGDAVRLYNLTDELPKYGSATISPIPPERQYSRKYNHRGEMIDHICVTRTLALSITKVDSVIESIEAENVTDVPTERFGKARPDHAPVYAVFEI